MARTPGATNRTAREHRAAAKHEAAMARAKDKLAKKQREIDALKAKQAKKKK